MKAIREKHRETANGVWTAEYRAWKSMKVRCNNKNSNLYKSYGGRGIKVCDSWNISFSAFLLDMGRKPDISFSLERKNNNLGYTPQNCKWATKQEQLNNTRQNHFLEWDGKNMTIAEWGRFLGVRSRSIAQRIYNGYTVEEALTLPKSRRRVLKIL